MTLGFLLDTNVVSELTKARPNASVIAWIAAAPSPHLSVLTLGELRRGAAGLRDRDPVRAERLDEWIDHIAGTYGDRVLDVDGAVMSAWAELPRQRTLPAIDSLIAATAISHDLALVTRNIKDFEGLGVAVVNPFDDA